MKKIINGKVYNTDTAKELGSWSNAGSWRDFSHVEEILYRKKTGEYFLHGEGGPATKYAVSTGMNSWTGGSKIIPLDYDAARQWAEDNLDADEYEEIFGVVEEDDTKVSATFRLSASTLENVKRMAAKEGMTISDYVDKILSN